jgi:hypothetical protein
VLRIFEAVLGGSDLDDLAQVHDGDAIGEMLDDAEVMGDEQVGETELLLEILQEVDDLCLDRHVERRNRFITDDQ